MIDVVAAIIKDGERVLIARKKIGKPLAGYWEFPGGKIEIGESPENALKRELKEEMEIEIKVGTYVGESIYDYGNTQVALKGYICNLENGEIRLKDHDRYRWIKIEDINNYTLAPADIPLANNILDMANAC